MKKDHYTPPSHTNNVPPSSQPGSYAIGVKGLLDPHWDWLEGLTVTHIKQDETIISGPLVDQAALHGLLARIRDINLTLLSVNQIEPDDL